MNSTAAENEFANWQSSLIALQIQTRQAVSLLMQPVLLFRCRFKCQEDNSRGSVR